MRTPWLAAGLLSVIMNTSAEPVPLYKPGARAPEPIDISLNRYGASPLAPEALEIGKRGPDFELPLTGGGLFALSDAAENGPVVLIFYRGHW